MQLLSQWVLPLKGYETVEIVDLNPTRLITRTLWRQMLSYLVYGNFTTGTHEILQYSKIPDVYMSRLLKSLECLSILEPRTL